MNNGGLFFVSMTSLVTGLGVPGTEWDRGRQASVPQFLQGAMLALLLA